MTQIPTEENFKYHPPLTDEQKQKHELVNHAAFELLTTDDVRLHLRELTGSSEDENNNPSSLRISKEDMLFARVDFFRPKMSDRP